MKKEFKRFDMSIPPRKVKWFLKPLIPLLINGNIKKHKPVITYVNTQDLKAPFLLLCNHNAFFDFSVAEYVLGKNEANYVVAIDGYLNREWLLRDVGCICKRKFTNDLVLIKNLKKAINMGNVVALYPEARYSLCGTTAVLPASLAKLAKFLKVPVVTLICHGHHVNSPFWDTSHDRGVVGTEATYKLLLTEEEVKDLSVDEINKRIVDEFQYDDFKWQKEKGIIINDPNRAKGLHRVLYKCPICGEEHSMTSHEATLECSSCGAKWEMTELGELKRTNGEDKFTHIPDWYEWERSCVAKEVENGTYSSGELEVSVDSLPKNKFIHLGKGTLIHDMNGFRVKGIDVDGDEFSMEIDAKTQYSVHIEYQYLFKHGDCIDLNTINDTWYVYPTGKFNVTKMALATEELYFKYQRDKGNILPKGLA